VLVWRPSALTAIADHLGSQDEIPHHALLVALEARSGRSRDAAQIARLGNRLVAGSGRVFKYYRRRLKNAGTGDDRAFCGQDDDFVGFVVGAHDQDF
jgi:hypothetical protein